MLEPVDLSDAQAAGEMRRQEEREHLVTHLLEVLDEDETSLNAAAIELTWSDDAGSNPYARHRQTDARGYRRANATLRRAIEDAVEANTTVRGQGFTLRERTEGRKVRTYLKRFGTPPSPPVMGTFDIPELADE